MSTLSGFIKDSYWAVGAQAVSLLTSVIVSFVLPKFVSVAEFGYWQYFLLLASYVGVLHFGFGDGVYLRLGGQYWNRIDRKEWMPKMLLCFLVQFCITLVLALWAVFCLPSDSAYRIVVLWLAVYISVENCYKTMTMAMMACDQMQYVSKTVVVDKLLMSVSVVSLILLGGANASMVIGCYVLAHCVVQTLVLAKTKPYKECRSMFSRYTFVSSLSVCGVGMILMLSNLVSILLVGICRFAVERFWDIVVFSKFSFSITIASFFLVFISQIGYVLFPVLRRMREDMQAVLFARLDFLLTALPLVSYVFFFVIYMFVSWWLPKYSESLVFLAFTAPFICYEIRVCLLYNTYFKNLGAIRALLYINVVSVLCAAIMYSLAVWLHDINVMALGLLLSEFIKVCLMSHYLNGRFCQSVPLIAKFECVYNVAFVAIYYFCGVGYALGLYLLSLIAILLLFKKEFIMTIKFVKEKR